MKFKNTSTTQVLLYWLAKRSRVYITNTHPTHTHNTHTHGMCQDQMQFANQKPGYDLTCNGYNNACIICHHLLNIRNRNMHDFDFTLEIGQCEVLLC